MRNSWSVIAVCGVLSAVLSCGASGAPSVDVVVPGDTYDPVGPYEVTAAIRGRATIVDARLRWYVGDLASARNVSLVHEAGSDLWRGGIPGVPQGSVVHFSVEVYDDEGHLTVRPEPVDGVAQTYAFLVRYPPVPDAGEADAGEVDAGEADAGEADAGEADAGEADAGEADAGTSDAGTSDAGVDDGGGLIAPGLPDGG